MTEILAPIDQLGCFTAWAGVTTAISARLERRNGPPEAVRMIFSTASRCATSSAMAGP